MEKLCHYGGLLVWLLWVYSVSGYTIFHVNQVSIQSARNPWHTYLRQCHSICFGWMQEICIITAVWSWHLFTYPQLNGKIENAVKTAKRLLKKAKADTKDFYLAVFIEEILSLKVLDNRKYKEYLKEEVKLISPTVARGWWIMVPPCQIGLNSLSYWNHYNQQKLLCIIIHFNKRASVVLLALFLCAIHCQDGSKEIE